jgi:hypothetical protein
MTHVRGCPLFTHPSQREPGHPTDCRCPGVKPGTQADRVRRYFLEHPGSSTWEASMDLRIANITARMSDCRKAGVVFVHWTDDTGTDRYRIAEPARVTKGEPIAMWAE